MMRNNPLLTLLRESKLSEEYDSSEIEVLKGLESVRRRPSLYLGDLDAPNLTTRLAFQTLCHAVDEFIDGNCKKIQIQVGDNLVVARYDVGLPLEPHSAADDLPAAMIFLALHMGCHNQKKNIEVGSELCELGLATLNGVCTRLFASVSSKGKYAEFLFEKGELKNTPNPIITDKEDYTEIEIELDNSILANTKFDISKILAESNRIVDKYSIPIIIEKMS